MKLVNMLTYKWWDLNYACGRNAYSIHPRRCGKAEDPLEKEKIRHVSPILLGRSSKLEHVALLKRMDHIRRAGNSQVAGCAYSFAMSEIAGGKNYFFMTHHTHALNKICILKRFYQKIKLAIHKLRLCTNTVQY